MKWTAGRQGTGYRKALLAQGAAWDCYLLDYPPGSRVPPHVDRVEGKRHYRVNVVLKRGEGGAFIGRTILNLGRVKFFRPDRALHMVAPVTRRRVVLSIGWVR